ncbi:MAG TPA: hypothetical protein VFM63_14115 [Pyrinomonadaceae bacterium]|nr:hypothetical protein [Pyrinomonadaceae bacterium]
MIVVEPSSLRFEVGSTGLSTDEHLLERISAAENRVARLAERLERSLDLLLRYAQNAYFDRSLVRALVSLLADDGVVQTERLEKLWNERCQRDSVPAENVHLVNHQTEESAKDAARNQCRGTEGKYTSYASKKKDKQNSHPEYPSK